MSTFYTACALGLLCLLLCLPGLLRAASRRYVLWGALLVFSIILAAWAPLDKWASQALSLLVSLVAVALLMALAGWKRQEFGLRLTFNPGTGRDVLRFLLPLMLVELVVLWALVPGGRTAFESHLFQLTAPGLTEELAFRGVLLALLDRGFLRRVRILGADLGWGAVVSSLLFGLCHGLRVGADFHVVAKAALMAIPLAGGFVLAWCRARSGSLLLPILVHGGMNELAQLIAAVKARGGSGMP